MICHWLPADICCHRVSAFRHWHILFILICWQYVVNFEKHGFSLSIFEFEDIAFRIHYRGFPHCCMVEQEVLILQHLDCVHVLLWWDPVEEIIVSEHRIYPLSMALHCGEFFIAVFCRGILWHFIGSGCCAWCHEQDHSLNVVLCLSLHGLRWKMSIALMYSFWIWISHYEGDMVMVEYWTFHDINMWLFVEYFMIIIYNCL